MFKMGDVNLGIMAMKINDENLDTTIKDIPF